MAHSSQSPEKSTETSQKTSKKISRKRRERPHPRSATTLKETLSECREDIIRLRDPEIIKSTLKHLNEYNDVAIPMPSDYDLLQQPFERVSMENASGSPSNRLRSKFFLSARTARNLKKIQNQTASQNSCPHNPPPWEIPEVVRDRMSLIRVCIIIHEIACYLSAVLTGLLIWHAFQGISWSSKNGSLTYSWVYTWLYQPLSTFSVVVTSVGFLLRVDLNSPGNLRRFLLFLLPTAILLGSFYAKKGLDLTDLELHHQKMELLSNTNRTANITDKTTGSYDISNSSTNSKIIVLTFVSLSALMALIISFYLHVHRHSFYLVRNYQNEYDPNPNE